MLKLFYTRCFIFEYITLKRKIFSSILINIFNTGKRMPDLYAIIKIILLKKEVYKYSNNNIYFITSDRYFLERVVRSDLGIASGNFKTATSCFLFDAYRNNSDVFRRADHSSFYFKIDYKKIMLS